MTKRMQSSMAAVPEDVIVEILCGLPVKTLLRFRCVSKQFRSIIDGPNFINRHLQKQYSSNRRRLIVEGMGSTVFSVDLDTADNAFELGIPFESRGPYFRAWGSDFRVIGSCNGLLAIALYSDTSVGLWNISTRKHQILPKFWSDFDETDLVLDGFGYDVAADDHKWVRVISDTESMTEVTVYSLKTNTWRRIENYPPYHDYFVGGIGVLIGSSLNWGVRIISNDEFRVMSFDLKDEKFHEVSLPEIGDVAEAVSYIEIVVLEGFLCLSYFYSLETGLDVWVMKEYGVKESWSKLFSLSAGRLLRNGGFGFTIAAFCYSKSSDRVLVYHITGEVFWHELDKKRDEDVEINEWPDCIRGAFIYMDSLVSPKISV